MGGYPCPFIVHFDSPFSAEKIMVDLRGNDVAAKLAAMNRVGTRRVWRRV
jgi:hypothetical protein